jgi:hypothetical protein
VSFNSLLGKNDEKRDKKQHATLLMPAEISVETGIVRVILVLAAIVCTKYVECVEVVSLFLVNLLVH